MLDLNYVNTVRLLLDVIPDVFADQLFAMKGGTAINLFLRDAPRLSVDIDLVYLPIAESRDEALGGIAAGLKRIAAKLEKRGLTARPIRAGSDPESKLLVMESLGGIVLKIEVNTVFRGTVLPVKERRLVSSRVVSRFGIQAYAPILDPAELYAGKLVAALDRQHPRDLFDVWMLYQHEGITPALLDCLVVYLAGHNRPTHEVLGGRDKVLDQVYAEQFVGMTEVEPPPLAILLESRARLRHDILTQLTSAQRHFLLGLSKAEPDWGLLTHPAVQHLPALRWKLQHLASFKDRQPAKSEAQSESLRSLLFPEIMKLTDVTDVTGNGGSPTTPV